MLSIFCFSSLLWWIKATSSIHLLRMLSLIVFICLVSPYLVISLLLGCYLVCSLFSSFNFLSTHFCVLCTLLLSTMSDLVCCSFWTFPPACASVSLFSCLIWLLMSLSNTFPMLLASAIPLSLLHFPFSPLTLYIMMISPSCHSMGMDSLYCNQHCKVHVYCSCYSIWFDERFICNVVWTCALFIFSFCIHVSGSS